MKFLSVFFGVLTVLLLSSCGIVLYPGQPGMISTNYVKLDLEDLEEPGLFVYEAVYDNKQGGAGVGAVVTKLYPGAQTYTSNVRTNADGTLYKAKAQYEGAEVQMISLPASNQVMISPTSKLVLMVDYDTSLDELDEKNAAETNLFKPMGAGLNARALEFKKMRWDLLRAGTLSPTGNLSYEISSLDLKDNKFTPSKPVKVETTFFQNALKSNLTSETKQEFVSFLETNYPMGYKGVVNVNVKGSAIPIPIKIGLHTIKTLEASGTKVIRTALTEKTVEEVLKKFKDGTLKQGVAQ